MLSDKNWIHTFNFYILPGVNPGPTPQPQSGKGHDGWDVNALRIPDGALFPKRTIWESKGMNILSKFLMKKMFYNITLHA